MKKFLYLLVLVLSIVLTGCSSCQSDKAKQETKTTKVFSADYDGVLPDLSKGASHIIATHRQTMYSIVKGKEYFWYETKFTFADTLKADTFDDNALVEVTSTFQTFEPSLVYNITTNAAKGTLIPTPTPGLWIEDFDLGNAEIKLSINDVIEKLKAWNGVMPPAKAFYLRKPVGPIACNAQYVAGNPFKAVWVDAVTGEITESCPAFPQLNMPLGEWP